jgi:lipopolysaccharide kinase (Kdo/WaaP) family protein
VTHRLLTADAVWDRRLQAAGLATVASIAAVAPLGEAVATSRTSRTDVIEIPSHRFHRKVYAYPEARDILRAALRGTLLGTPRALREWRALRSLLVDGVLVVEPVAVGVIRRWGFVRMTILLTRTVDGGRPLDRYLVEHQDDDERRRTLDRAAAVLARAHSRGHVLGAPALRDLIHDPADGGIRLLDLPRHRAGRRMTLTVRARDLARLDAALGNIVSDKQRWSALAAYVRESGPGCPGAQDLAARIRQEARPWNAGETRRLKDA